MHNSNPACVIERYARIAVPAAIAAAMGFLNLGRSFPDSSYYREYSLFILGKASAVNEIVAMRPMLPLLSSFVSVALGDLDLSYGTMNTVFWVLGTLVAYEIAVLILRNHEAATLAALIYATSPAMLWFGAAVLVDSPAYFFTGFSVLAALKPVKGPEPTWRRLLQDVVVATGLFCKESVLFGLVFLLATRAYKRNGFKITLASVLLSMLAGMGTLASLSIDPFVFVRKLHLAQQIPQPYGDPSWGIIPLVKSFTNAFVPYFPSVVRYSLYPFFGLAGLLSVRMADRKVLLMCLVILSVNAFIWPVMTYRFSFVAWPPVVMLLAAGIKNFSEKFCSLAGLPKSSHSVLGYMIVAVGIIVTAPRIIQWI